MPRLEDADSFREATMTTIVRKVEQVVSKENARSNLFRDGNWSKVPQFDRSEIVTARVVGRGTYGVVREIQSIQLHDDDDDSDVLPSSQRGYNNHRKKIYDSNSSISVISDKSKRSSIRSLFHKSSTTSGSSAPKATNEDNCSTRELLAQDVRSRKGKRYVVKEVEKSLLQTDRVTYLKGMIDLALEANLLAALEHPRVIQLRGLSSQNPSNDSAVTAISEAASSVCFSTTPRTTAPAPFRNLISHFVILEQLEETLPQRLSAWMQKKRATQGITGRLTCGNRQSRSQTLLMERLLVGYHVADVMQYLHSRNIIYRDLRPDNIGFTRNSELKLFDFGLARELCDQDRNADDTYLLTGCTGTLRYMAPEVGLRRPYNMTADVYSWSMMMWYLMALEPPFGMYTNNMFFDRVFAKHYRPAVKDKWPSDICALMKKCWHVNPKHRPQFEDVASHLRTLLLELDPEADSLL